MRSVTEVIEKLKDQYDGSIDFKQVCIDNNIIVFKTRLPDDAHGFTANNHSYKVIVLNQSLSYQERRDWAAHELWHALRGGLKNKKEEAKADLFAALLRAPNVKEGDDIEALTERYNVSRRLAKIRIEYEIKKERS